MTVRINSVSALRALQSMESNSINLARSLERLSSGLRINTGGDDPAGLIISEQLRGQINGLKAATRAVGESVNFFRVVEAALNEVSTLLINLRGMAIIGVNGATSQDQRNALNFEFQNATDSIQRISQTSRFGTDRIFGTVSGANVARTFQLTENAGSTGDSVQFTFADFSRAGSITVNGITIAFSSVFLLIASSNLLSSGSASIALGRISQAITSISTYRGALGAFQRNIFESQQRFLAISIQNLTASESFIRDANIPEETISLTRNQILVQASTAMLAQANFVTQNLLSLLQG